MCVEKEIKETVKDQKKTKWRCMDCIYHDYIVDRYYPGSEHANHRCRYTGNFYPGTYPACKYFKL